MNAKAYMDKLKEEKGEGFAMAVHALTLGIAVANLIRNASLPDDRYAEVMESMIGFQVAAGIALETIGGWQGKEMRDAIDAYLVLAMVETVAEQHATH